DVFEDNVVGEQVKEVAGPGQAVQPAFDDAEERIERGEVVEVGDGGLHDDSAFPSVTSRLWRSWRRTRRTRPAARRLPRGRRRGSERRCRWRGQRGVGAGPGRTHLPRGG